MQLTEKELQETKERRKEVRASLACEGIYLTDEEEKLFEDMDQQHMPHEDRIAYAKAYFRKKHGLSPPPEK